MRVVRVGRVSKLGRHSPEGRAGAERCPASASGLEGRRRCSRMARAVAARRTTSTTRRVPPWRGAGEDERALAPNREPREQTEGGLREVALPQCPTEGSAAVRCSRRREEFHRAIDVLDGCFALQGGPSRTVAPGVTGFNPGCRPGNFDHWGQKWGTSEQHGQPGTEEGPPRNSEVDDPRLCLLVDARNEDVRRLEIALDDCPAAKHGAVGAALRRLVVAHAADLIAHLATVTHLLDRLCRAGSRPHVRDLR